jgi:hypothetical protein
MNKILLATLCFAMTTAVASDVVSGQNPESVALPEYYGIYALIDGKLCGITVPTQDCAVKTLDVKIGNINVKAIEYRKGTRFLVYQENPSMFAAALSLRPMVFVRNIIYVPMIGQNQSRTQAANYWQLAIPNEVTSIEESLQQQVQPIQFLVKPFKANSVLAVPAKELTPGMYHFSGKDLTASSELYFWVGSAAESEINKCADIVRSGTMGIAFNDSYKSCSEEMKSAQAVNREAGVSGDSSMSTTTAELIEISKKLAEADVRGDKATIESYLTDDFVYRDVGNHKSMDRVKFLSRIKPNKSIKSYNCHDYNLSFEANQAVLNGLCEYDVRDLILALNVRQRFTDKFVKQNGIWKLAVAETMVLPNR